MVIDNFEASLRLPKMILEWAGLRIQPKKDKSIFKYYIKALIFYFNSLWLGPDVVGEFYWLIEGMYMGKTLDELCMNAPCSTVCVLATVKLWCLYFNRDTVDKIVEKLRSIHPRDDESESTESIQVIEKGILKEALKFLNMVMMFLCCSSVGVLIVFGTAPVLSMVYDYYSTGTIEYKVPFRIKYFFEMNTLNRWAVVYAHQIGSMLVTCVDLLGTDTLFYALCTYLQMHFRLLCLQLENAVSENSAAETRENFRKAVKRHQELIDLVAQIELLYSKSTLCNIVLSSLLICLSGFIVTFVKDVGTVSCFVAFLVMNLTQISLLCMFGDMLASASIRVGQAVYRCKWYNTEPDIKKNVLIVIIRSILKVFIGKQGILLSVCFVILRAQTACKLTAMQFADLNLNALSAILRTSWSYFALLKTMYD